jgi:hypothetical protein
MRTLKPEAFTSMSLSDVERGVRWTFGGLWTHCDDDGRALYDPRLLKAAIYPLDDAVSAATIAADMSELERVGAVCFYEIDGRSYVHVPAWAEHQHPNRKVPSKVPACPKNVHSSTAHAQRSESAVPTQPQSSPVVVVVEESRGEVDVEGGVASATKAPAQLIIARWLEHCDHRPPKSVVGQVARHVGNLIAEGISPDHVERGLAQWATRDLAPTVIPSFVNNVMNPGRPAQGTAMAKAQGWLDIGKDSTEQTSIGA